MRVLASVGLDHVEGVGVARGRRGVPLALVVHLPVDQHQRTCEFDSTSSFNKESLSAKPTPYPRLANVGVLTG